MEPLEGKIRYLTIPQLKILKVLSESEFGVLDSQEIMDTTHTATATFGAYITSLKKLKSNDGQPIVIPAGRTDEGTRWQVNEKVISKEKLKQIIADLNVDNIL
ncbi:MAG: hypothetical protein PHE48_00045 [Candidatus Daviesbacteria bacterium]|nr:hypothetical protein [Candidatus Daviesbacteria bacterium]